MKTTKSTFPVNDDEVMALNSLDFILLAVYFLAELDHFDFLRSLTLDILDDWTWIQLKRLASLKDAVAEISTF